MEIHLCTHDIVDMSIYIYIYMVAVIVYKRECNVCLLSLRSV